MAIDIFKFLQVHDFQTGKVFLLMPDDQSLAGWAVFTLVEPTEKGRVSIVWKGDN